MILQIPQRLTALWGVALAAVVLLPFLGKAYTIDDPIFLREAQHILTDPLHPQAFEMVWSSDRRLRGSEFLPGGPVAGYLLLPLAAFDWDERAGHLLTLAYFVLAILGTVALSRRVGLDESRARDAGLLLAASPVAVAMAGTVMPDVASMTASVWGMERLLAWRAEKRLGQGIVAAGCLALAALLRIHAVLLLPLAALVLWRSGVRWRQHWPVALGAALVIAFTTLTRDATGGTVSSVAIWLLRLPMAERHLIAALVAWTLTTPLVVPGLLAETFPRWRQVSPVLVGLAVGAVLWTSQGTLVAALAGLVALGFVLHRAIRSRTSTDTLLALWLLVPTPLIVYIHFAPKYLLPALPAAAILASRALGTLAPLVRRQLRLTALALGAGFGVLLLQADRVLAGEARDVARIHIAPRVTQGQRVWFVGHWGFHWYAEEAGATPVALEGPFPEPGDIVVSATVDRSTSLQAVPHRRLVLTVPQDSIHARIMSSYAGAGFYSDHWGLLPWAIGLPEGVGFQVWEVQATGGVHQ